MEPRPGAVAGPLGKPAIAGRPRAVACRQVTPLGSGGEDPEDPVQHLPPIPARAATLGGRRQKRLEATPLRLGQIVPLHDLELGLHEAPTNACAAYSKAQYLISKQSLGDRARPGLSAAFAD
jgi:hypothetical protein